MITGFNTDIKHGERVFHVQTEDRGLANPVVESLVYVGGEILLSKKSPYKDHVAGDRVDEKIVKEMMEVQHRLIIEAIRRGRFDGAQPGGPSPEISSEFSSPVSPAAAAAAAAILGHKTGPVPAVQSARVSHPVPPLSGKPVPVSPAAPASHARAGHPEGAAGERSLDQVIIDYLASEASSEHLELSLVKGGELVSGSAVSLSIRASTSLTEKPVPGAHVSVRVVSPAGPPQMLFRGVTGNDGLVKATCSIPDVGSANAALIVAASSSIGNNELKQVIARKPK